MPWYAHFRIKVKPGAILTYKGYLRLNVPIPVPGGGSRDFITTGRVAPADMGLLHDAIEVLGAGAVAVPVTAVLGQDPQPVALARRAGHGAVMFLLRRTTGDVMAIVALLERRDSTWAEVALVHKPWWDPAEAFEDDDLMLTGGHSRFVTDGDANLVLVPGQAAPGTSVARADGDDIAVHSPWGHFIYLGELAATGECVTLTARRPGVEQTAVFEPIGPR